MTFTDTIFFSLLAAVLSLDQMAFCQMLISRPILSALLLGAVFGDIREAALVGVCLELLFVRSIPLKERTAADPTLATAAVLGGIWGSSSSLPASLHPIAAVPFAAALGLLASFLSKWFDLRLRDVNTALFHKLHRVGSVQFTAICALFAKSAGFYLLAILAVQGALPKIMSSLGPAAVPAAAVAWVALFSICVAYASTLLFQGLAAVWWGVGLGLGCAGVVFVRSSALPLSVVSMGILIVFVFHAFGETIRHLRKRPAPRAAAVGEIG